MKRVVLLIIDQLAGHWAEGVTVPSTGLAPPNVTDYVAAGLLPNFAGAIQEGLWVKRPMNQGVCMTPYALRYIAAGRYDTASIKKTPLSLTCAGQFPTFLVALVHGNPAAKKRTVKVGTFGSSEWINRGWLASPYFHVGLPGYFDDLREMEEYAFPWMQANPDWTCSLIYLPQHDNFKRGSPIWRRNPRTYNEDKHHHLTDYVDGYVGAVTRFLKENGWWQETLLVVGSDHAYHSGCSACPVPPEKKNDPEYRFNHIFDHQGPYDCKLWDSQKNHTTRKLSECCRRITLLLTGGGLPKRFRGTSLDTAEIIDMAPTVMGYLGIPFECDGRDLLSPAI